MEMMVLRRLVIYKPCRGPPGERKGKARKCNGKLTLEEDEGIRVGKGISVQAIGKAMRK